MAVMINILFSFLSLSFSLSLSHTHTHSLPLSVSDISLTIYLSTSLWLDKSISRIDIFNTIVEIASVMS